MFPVDLPSNWMSLHPSLNERTVKYLHLKNKEKVDNFAQKVLSGDSYFKCLREIVQDIVISPVSIGYYFVGRFILSKTFYASSKCNSCDLCINSCPVKAIIKIDNRPFWTFNCESCMKCMRNCPHRAIETAHGFIIGFMILMSTVVLGMFYRYFEKFFFAFENGIVSNIVEILIYIGCLWISYYIIHFLMRFRFFERLMDYTSLTSYRFWGKRYKALKVNDLNEHQKALESEKQLN